MRSGLRLLPTTLPVPKVANPDTQAPALVHLTAPSKMAANSHSYISFRAFFGKPGLRWRALFPYPAVELKKRGGQNASILPGPKNRGTKEEESGEQKTL